MMTISAVAFAVKKLSKRPYSIQEINNTLIKAGYVKSEIEEAIEKLLLKGYLDDAALARNMFDYYTLQKSYGPFLLMQKLREKALSDDHINEVMQEYSTEKELEIIHIIANKPVQKNERENQALLIRRLQRKGFSYDAINKYILSKWSYNNRSGYNTD